MFLYTGDFFFWLLKLGEGIGLISGVLVWLGVLLVPTLGPGGDFMLGADGDLMNPKAFLAAILFKLGLCTRNPL